MIEMKPEKCETDQINNCIGGDLEKLVCDRIKVFRISFYEPQPYEIEINEMEYEEN